MKLRALDVVFRLREIEKRSARSALARSILLEHQASAEEVGIATGILAETAFLDQNRILDPTSSNTSWLSTAQLTHAAAVTIQVAAQVATHRAVASLAKSQAALHIVSIALNQHALEQHEKMISRHQRDLDEFRHGSVSR